MHDIVSHQGSANQKSQWDTTSYLLGWLEIKSQIIKYWSGWVETGTFIHCWVNVKWYNCFEKQFLKWLSLELATWPRNSTPGVYLREKMCPHRNLNMNLYSSIIHNSLKKQPNCPSADEGIHEMWDIHTMEQYLVIKRNGILIHDTTWMNFEDLLSERNQSHTKM